MHAVCQLLDVARLPFIVSALQASTGMVDSASQAEDILDNDGGIRGQEARPKRDCRADGGSLAKRLTLA